MRSWDLWLQLAKRSLLKSQKASQTQWFSALITHQNWYWSCSNQSFWKLRLFLNHNHHHPHCSYSRVMESLWRKETSFCFWALVLFFSFRKFCKDSFRVLMQMGHCEPWCFFFFPITFLKCSWALLMMNLDKIFTSERVPTWYFRCPYKCFCVNSAQNSWNLGCITDGSIITSHLRDRYFSFNCLFETEGRKSCQLFI